MKSSRYPQVVAHRGGAGASVDAENKLQTIKDTQAHLPEVSIEIDVRVHQRVLVVSHDKVQNGEPTLALQDVIPALNRGQRHYIDYKEKTLNRAHFNELQSYAEDCSFVFASFYPLVILQAARYRASFMLALICKIPALLPLYQRWPGVSELLVRGDLLSSSRVAKIKDHNKSVYAWTIRPESVQAIADLDVDVIATDHPAKALEILKK